MGYYLLPVLCIALVFLRGYGSLEGGIAVDYVPLEGDAVYEFSWAGSVAAARAEDAAALHSREEGTYYFADFRIIRNKLLIFT